MRTIAYPHDSSNGLLDAILNEHKLKNDAELSRKLEVAPPVLSKIRHGRLPFGAGMIVKVQDAFGWTLPAIRKYLPAK